MSRLFISFSGGETSAFMTWAILNSPWRSKYDDIRVLFANTGQENEETLEFVEKCDKAFGFGVTWLEAVTYPGERKGPTSRVVDFSTASRDGRPFEDVIRKYGIPNSKFKHCTRALKLSPMLSHLAETGWPKGSYDTAIGIRSDEIDRMSSSAREQRIVYPLIEWLPTTKPQINTWWERQPFRLNLKGYQGNCTWCWKKSFRKHITLISESPEIYDFPRLMESKYGLIGPEFKKDNLPNGYKRTFFRGNRSTEDIFLMHERRGESFIPATDDSVVYSLFDPGIDAGGGCEESCEVFSDEDNIVYGAEP